MGRLSEFKEGQNSVPLKPYFHFHGRMKIRLCRGEMKSQIMTGNPGSAFCNALKMSRRQNFTADLWYAEFEKPSLAQFIFWLESWF